MKPMRGRRASRSGVAVALAAAAAAWCAPAARAGTASVQQVPACGGDLACSKYNPGWTVGVVTFTDAAGEANALTVSQQGGAVTFTDTGAPLTAGTGCTAADPSTVVCALPPGEASGLVSRLTIDTGAGDDAVTIAGTLRAALPLATGAGADVVRGGGETDVIDGGPGPDLVDGGGGSDVADYSRRAAAVVVDLRTGRGGEAGEADRLTGIERVAGGDGDDSLTGGASADGLEGGDGDDLLRAGPGDDALSGGVGGDRIEGGAGDDTVLSDYEQGDDYYTPTFAPGDDVVWGGAGDDGIEDGAGGANTFRGGAGDDSIYGGPEADRIDGGPGRDELDGDYGGQALGSGGPDQLRGGPGADLLFGGIGRDRLLGGEGRDAIVGGRGVDVLVGGSGADRLFARDRRRERVRCGDGRDLAAADAADAVAGSCERTVTRRALKPPEGPEGHVAVR